MPPWTCRRGRDSKVARTGTRLLDLISGRTPMPVEYIRVVLRTVPQWRPRECGEQLSRIGLVLGDIGFTTETAALNISNLRVATSGT